MACAGNSLPGWERLYLDLGESFISDPGFKRQGRKKLDMIVLTIADYCGPVISMLLVMMSTATKMLENDGCLFIRSRLSYAPTPFSIHRLLQHPELD